MQYPDDNKLVPSTIPPLEGVAVHYKATLDNLVSLVHGRQYRRNKSYTKGELRALTPTNILQWMNTKTFGVADPPTDANPTLARGNSLAYWKKAVSFFMPNRLIPWVSGRNEGNPTRSIEVNNLIRRVKRKEVRKQGVTSKCRRAMTEDEFRKMQNILHEHRDGRNSGIWRYGLYALTNFQFHLIARIDDTTQVLIDNIRVHDSFCNALKTRLNWLKNVSEERDAPWQIVLGSMDTAFCVYTSLALWMEWNHRDNPNAFMLPYVFNFSDDNSIPGGGLKAKETAQIMFNKIFKMDEFLGDGGAAADHLGSHSIRKYAATQVRRSGCSKDDRDIRGRWKTKARVSDVYEDTELPYPDAKVAETLCIGGACYYLFPEELTNEGAEEGRANMTAMMKTYILSNVVPNIRRRLPEAAALVLGKALLWLIYSMYDATNNVVPQNFRNRIRREINEIVSAADAEVDCNDPGYNPIRRVPVVVTGREGCVYIDVIPAFDGDGDAAGGGGGGQEMRGAAAGGLQAQLLAVQAMTSQIRRELQELRTNQMADTVVMTRGFNVVNSNIRRFGFQPGVRGGGAAGQGNDDTRTAAVIPAIAGHNAAAILSPNPCTLYDLWREYEVGIGGRKAAKLFSYTERGKVKHKYSRRKVIWSMVCGLVRLGITAEVAIDQIYSAYGEQTSVTDIINAIKKDRRDGTLNPNLRV